MRIDSLRLQNFRGFADREFRLHPQFNLVVGENGSGKTSLLEGAAVAAGIWLHLVGAREQYPLTRRNVRQEFSDGTSSWVRRYPCCVDVGGTLGADQLTTWRFEIATPSSPGDLGRVHKNDELKQESGNELLILPLVAFYRSDRNFGLLENSASADQLPDQLLDKESSSRSAGYLRAMAQRLSLTDLHRWVVRQSLIAFQEDAESTTLDRAVRDAVASCIPGADEVYFDARASEIAVGFSDGSRQLVSNLSDGQRGMLALVGDLAQKAATLNPQLNADVLKLTPGLVLIDELDLHLHPRWQRLIVEQLRTCFPKVQFVCTTHSPFLIQSLRSGEELINLDGQTVSNLADLTISEIARGIQGIAKPEVSARYEEMKHVARSYLESLGEADGQPEEKLANLKDRLASVVAPYADNPAFQAFLEMKRVARLGS